MASEAGDYSNETTGSILQQLITKSCSAYCFYAPVKLVSTRFSNEPPSVQVDLTSGPPADVGCPGFDTPCAAMEDVVDPLGAAVGGLSLVHGSALTQCGAMEDVVDTTGATADGAVASSREEPITSASIDAFINTFKKPLPEPLLSTPILRTTRVVPNDDTLEWLPKRSARLAAKTKDKPDAQARKVLMRKLGYEVEIERPNEASFQEFHEAAFQVALAGEAEMAMQIFFHGKRQSARCAGAGV